MCKVKLIIKKLQTEACVSQLALGFIREPQKNSPIICAIVFSYSATILLCEKEKTINIHRYTFREYHSYVYLYAGNLSRNTSPSVNSVIYYRRNHSDTGRVIAPCLNICICFNCTSRFRGYGIVY